MALRPRIVHGREARLPASVDLGRDVGRGSGRFDLPADGIDVVTRVGQHDAAGGQALQRQCAAVLSATCPSVDRR